MIRILKTPERAIPAVHVLRRHFGMGVTLKDIKVMLVDAPTDLPHIDNERIERKLRQDLLDVGCDLEETCSHCLGNDVKRCPGCYDRHMHCAHEPPADYDGPICGSMHFFTSCGRHWFEHRKEEPPRVHPGLLVEEREAIISKVDCPECREALTNWGYLK